MPILHWSDSEIRDAGTWVAEWVARHFATVPEKRITPEVSPAETDRLFDEPLPERPSKAADVLRAFEEKVARNSFTLTHPGYFGLMNPTPVPIAVFAEALAAALNQNVAAWHHGPAATALEKRVIRWLAQLIGMPGGTFGIIANGGSAANLVGLKAGLTAMFPDAATKGLTRLGKVPVVYASEESHFSIPKAVDVLGLGRDQLRPVPTDERYRMSAEALTRVIQQDRRAGLHPFCVIATAGTTSSGAVDPLPAVAEICAREKLWFHVDAAFGGGAAMSRTHGKILTGIERADSVTIDPHKWLFVPFEAGVCLVRDGVALRRAFDTPATYIPASPGREEEAVDFRKYGIQGSRGFLGLKIWMALKELGRETYERAVDEQYRLARSLADRIAATPGFEVAAPLEMPILCFRYRPPSFSGSEAKLNAVQVKLREALIRDGRFWVSVAYLKDRAWIRLHVISYLTDDEVLDRFYDHCIQTVAQL